MSELERKLCKRGLDKLFPGSPQSGKKGLFRLKMFRFETGELTVPCQGGRVSAGSEPDDVRGPVNLEFTTCAVSSLFRQLD